jgi:site-specific DNA recombinase
MRVAIYARYSSDNQRPESIEDQVRACEELAVAGGYTVDPAHIYKDQAKSGVLKDRPGLEALLAAARAHKFDGVLVDDLSRLSRDNHFLLTLYAEFRFSGVRIIARADSLDSDDDHAKLGFQMRGIVNELYLDDLREKTLRGQKGQKARGFTVGEATYGYRSVPVGDAGRSTGTSPAGWFSYGHPSRGSEGYYQTLPGVHRRQVDQVARQGTQPRGGPGPPQAP